MKLLALIAENNMYPRLRRRSNLTINNYGEKKNAAKSGS